MINLEGVMHEKTMHVHDSRVDHQLRSNAIDYVYLMRIAINVINFLTIKLRIKLKLTR